MKVIGFGSNKSASRTLHTQAKETGIHKRHKEREPASQLLFGCGSSLISCLKLSPVTDAGRGRGARHRCRRRQSFRLTAPVSLISCLLFVKAIKSPSKSLLPHLHRPRWPDAHSDCMQMIESLLCARAHRQGSWNLPRLMPLINDSWDSHTYTCAQQYKRLIGILFPLSKGGQTLVIKLQFLQGIK